MNAEPRSALVVIPAWNESSSIAEVVADVRSRGHNVLVVDDGSRDSTSARARAAGGVVLRLPVNLGVGAALRCGLRYAVAHGYGRVVQCDADGQHPADSITDLIEAAESTGAHLLIGSRFRADDAGMAVSRLRRLTMRLLARAATKATGAEITDATSGFRVISEPLLSQFARNFPAHYLGDTFEAVVSAGRAGYVVAEVPVSMRERRHGESSASPMAAIAFTLRAAIVVGARLHVQMDPLQPGSDATPSADGGDRL